MFRKRYVFFCGTFLYIVCEIFISFAFFEMSGILINLFTQTSWLYQLQLLPSIIMRDMDSKFGCTIYYRSTYNGETALLFASS